MAHFCSSHQAKANTKQNVENKVYEANRRRYGRKLNFLKKPNLIKYVTKYFFEGFGCMC